MKKLFLIISLLSILMLITGCGKEKKSQEYDESKVMSSMKMVNKLSKSQVENISLDDMQKIFSKYKYRMDSIVYAKNFDMLNPIIAHSFTYGFDERYYPAKYDLIYNHLGVTNNYGEYQIIQTYKVTYRISSDATIEDLKIIEDDDTVYYILVNLTYTFDQFGKLIAYSNNTEIK